MKKSLMTAALCLILTGCAGQSTVLPDSQPEQLISVPESRTENSISSGETVQQTAKPLADYLNENARIRPLYEISDTRTLLDCSRSTGYPWAPVTEKSYAVYDSSTGTLGERFVFDTQPQCRSGGFWVMKAAKPDTEDSMRLRGSMQPLQADSDCFTDLLMYDWDFHLLAQADLRALGTVSAIEADPANGTVWYLTEQNGQTADGFRSSARLMQRNADGTEAELYAWSSSYSVSENKSSAQPHALNSMNRLIRNGDVLVFTGFTNPETPTGPLLPAWGVISLTTGEMQIHDSPSDETSCLLPAGDCVFAVRQYDIYHPKENGMLLRILPSGKPLDYPVLNQLELESGTDPHDLRSGRLYATLMQKQTEGGGVIARVTVYDESGQVIHKSDLQTDAGSNFGSVFLQQGARALLAETAEGWVTVPF